MIAETIKKIAKIARRAIVGFWKRMGETDINATADFMGIPELANATATVKRIRDKMSETTQAPWFGNLRRTPSTTKEKTGGDELRNHPIVQHDLEVDK